MWSLFGRIFGREESTAATTASSDASISAIDKLNEQLSMLEKREKLYEKRLGEERAKATQLAKAGNKRGAIACLKRSKLYEKELENITNQQNRLMDQIMLLDSAQDTAATVQALKAGAEAMKAVPDVDEVEKVIEEIGEANDMMKQVEERLAEPVNDFDEDALEQELEELDLEDKLTEPAPKESEKEDVTELPSVPSSKVPRKQTNSEAEEKQQFTSLQAEMAA